jgi:hypothetical protein
VARKMRRKMRLRRRRREYPRRILRRSRDGMRLKQYAATA